MGMKQFFRNIKLFFEYKKAIKKNKKAITTYQYQFDRDKRLQPAMRIDSVLRIYSVVNLPEETQVYMDAKIVQTHISSYIRSVDEMFRKNGLAEIIGIRDIKQLDETHYLIVFGFTQFDTAKIARRLLIGSAITLTTLFIILYNYL